jgi:hypothetical protein
MKLRAVRRAATIRGFFGNPPVGLDPMAPSGDAAYGHSATQRKSPMPLVTVVLTLIVVGVLLWLVNTYIPMDGKIKSILNGVVVIAVVLWLLYGFGILGHGNEIRMPVVN